MGQGGKGRRGIEARVTTALLCCSSAMALAPLHDVGAGMAAAESIRGLVREVAGAGEGSDDGSPDRTRKRAIRSGACGSGERSRVGHGRWGGARQQRFPMA
jgi:hypothetical protein